METLDLKIKKRHDSTSMLFRQLFLLNLQLENYEEKDLQFESEINEVIRAIDQLMGVILRDVRISVS